MIRKNKIFLYISIALKLNLLFSTEILSQTEFTPSLWTASSKFGSSIAATSNIVVIGAAEQTVSSINKRGAAYVFDVVSGTQLTQLIASDGAATDYFGYSVAIDRNNSATAIVAAYGDNVGANNDQGSVYVYYRDYAGVKNSWTEVKHLFSSNGIAYGYFGTSCAIYDNIIAVGAPKQSVSGFASSGSVYVYARDNGGINNWGEVQIITNPSPAASQFTGQSVALIKDYLFVASTGETSSRGRVRIYQNISGTWTLIQTITPSIDAVGNIFGTGLSVDNETKRLVVSSPNATSNQGRVFVYEFNGSTWTETATFQANDPTTNDKFGQSLSISGNYIVIGAPTTTTTATGSVYIFERSLCTNSGWNQKTKYTFSSPYQNTGNSTAWLGTYALFGAQLSDGSSLADRGAAFKVDTN